MELKEGMYVRTENGIIEKINKIYDRHATDNVVIWLNGYGDGRSVFIDDFEEVKYQSINARGFIKKEPSFNLIDLIEVGDIVKLFMEDDIGKEDTNIFELVAVTIDKKQIGVFNSDFQIEFFPIENLRGILTKEQFSQIEYKVEQ